MEKEHHHKKSHEKLMEVIKKIKEKEHKAKKKAEEMHKIHLRSLEDAD